MDTETKHHIEQLNHRFAALTTVVTDAMTILADIAPEQANQLRRRHRMLVQAIENGTFRSGDQSLLEGHRFIRDLLETACEGTETGSDLRRAPAG